MYVPKNVNPLLNLMGEGVQMSFLLSNYYYKISQQTSWGDVTINDRGVSFTFRVMIIIT